MLNLLLYSWTKGLQYITIKTILRVFKQNTNRIASFSFFLILKISPRVLYILESSLPLSYSVATSNIFHRNCATSKWWNNIEEDNSEDILPKLIKFFS